MGFMELEIETGLFLSVETDNGTEIIPADLVNLCFREADNTPIETLDDESSLSAVRDFVRGEPQSVTIKRGMVGWRLSAPGYMDATDWRLADSEDAAFREACDENDDICIECGRTDCTGERDDGLPFCLDCVRMAPWMVDTAQSTDGTHDATDGRAFLVRFDDCDDDVIVTARYTAPDEDSALDIACALICEHRADFVIDEASGETDETVPHDVQMERARAMADKPVRLARRYAAGGE